MASGKRIKEKMEEKGINAQKLADIVGVSRSTIFLDIKGDVEEIPAGRLAAIAEALGTTWSYLMEKETALPENGESGKIAAAIVDSLDPERQQEGIRYLEYLDSLAKRKRKQDNQLSDHQAEN